MVMHYTRVMYHTRDIVNFLSIIAYVPPRALDFVGSLFIIHCFADAPSHTVDLVKSVLPMGLVPSRRL